MITPSVDRKVRSGLLRRLANPTRTGAVLLVRGMAGVRRRGGKGFSPERIGARPAL